MDIAKGDVTIEQLALTYLAAKLRPIKLFKCKNSFEGDTLVSTEFGLKPISEIKIGDLVWSFNSETEADELQPITHLIRGSGEKILVEIELEDGSSVVATDEHPFYVISEDDWVNAIDLEIGNLLFSRTGSNVRITSKRVYTEEQNVFNITVQKTHTYFVTNDEILNHNTGACDYLKAIWKKPKPSSKRLGNNLESKGIAKPGSDYQAHHIIPANAKIAKESQDVLASFGIHADDALNGVWVKSSAHVGRHTDKYIHEVNRRIKPAGTSRTSVLEELNDIRDDIASGKLKVR